MHLVAPLIAGIRGCENGTAQLFARGTSQRANYWLSFEADQQISTGADLNLDANGGVEVYVGQLVDVVAKSSTGLEVRRFTAGEEAPAIEVRSQSFTGIDYVTAQSAAGNPTTLQVALDRLKTSFGAVDFNVLIGSTATPMSTFAAAVSGIYFNVKDPTYGAKGDAVTDDTGAIQAALTAAQATFPGGTVVFPRGIYRTTSVLSLPKGVSMLGVGIDSSVIKLDHPNANTVSVTGGTAGSAARCVISGMSFKQTQVNSGNQLQLTDNNSNVVCYDCFFDQSGAAGTGRSVSVGAITGSTLRLIGCRFLMALASRAVVVSAGELFALFCNTTWAAGAYGNTAWQSDSGGTLTACSFDPTGVTSGAFFSIAMTATASGASPNAVIGCSFLAPTGGTHQVGMNLGCWDVGNWRPPGAVNASSPVVLVVAGPTSSSSFSMNGMLGLDRSTRRLTHAGNVVLPDDNGTIVAEFTGAAIFNVQLPSFVLGRRMMLYLWNNTATNRGYSMTGGTGVDRLVSPGFTGTANANTFTVHECECLYMNGLACWFTREVVTNNARPV